jgi:CRP-like cAMP-binding protein
MRDAGPALIDTQTETVSIGQPETAPLPINEPLDASAAAATAVQISRSAFVRRNVEGFSNPRAQTRPPAAKKFSNPKKNWILASLPQREYAELSPHLVTVPLEKGALLNAGTTDQPAMFFPTDGIVSVLHLIRDGRSVEVAMIGREGLVGVSSLMGGRDRFSQAVVQHRGWACRIAGEVLRRSFNRCLGTQGLFLRYAQSLYLQSAQTAVCIRHHSVLQQFVRRLLLGLDRSTSATLALTHEAMAAKLGVRRESVTEAAGKLHALGLINYRRGRVVVLDRSGLERHCCECYDVERQESARLRPECTVAIEPHGASMRGASRVRAGL